MKLVSRPLWLLAAWVGTASLLAADPVGLPPDENGKSPVETFRELLAMPSAERKAALADRPPEVQRELLAKVREYSSMRPNERDVRLEATELYYYLWPLMKTPATNREAQLALIPERQRGKVEGRIREWDKLPGPKQQELLTNALTVSYYAGLRTQPPLPPQAPVQAGRLDNGVARWGALPEGRRRQITTRFNQFFELTDEEKQRTLNTLSEPERRQIQQTLNKFARLTPAEREEYMASLEKFAKLSPADRQRFMKQAEQWSALSADERLEWRQMVDDLARTPPLPPGAGPPPLPTPPSD